MASITTSEALIGQAGDFNGKNYSGTFIPTLWSAKLLKKFYTATVLGEVTNTDYGGEIKNMGDKIVINTIPTLTINAYEVGTALTYEVPTPSTLEMTIDKGFYFAFQVNDVLAHQSQPNLMDTFSNDASMQLKIKTDSTVLYNGILGSGNVVADNKGATAGVKSGAYDLGTDDTPVALTSANVLQTITSLASVLDEQNIPDTERFLIIDPVTRQLLLNSNLAQAQFMGDSQSILRNGRIGGIDRFTVYVSNNLPKAAAGSNTPWVSGDGTENSITSTGDAKRRMIVAGHKSWLAYATQLTKMETVRNPNDFGDFVRCLQVFGYKAVQPKAAAVAIVS
jgi:hypothetical protein